MFGFEDYGGSVIEGYNGKLGSGGSTPAACRAQLSVVAFDDAAAVVLEAEHFGPSARLDAGQHAVVVS